MRRFFSCMILALTCLTGWAASRIVERPVTGGRATSSIEINKVEMTDTATILYVDAFYRPNNWIRIAGNASLQGGGKTYGVICGEGIKIDEQFWMPESGKASFKLFFPPVDKTLKTVDFIECEEDGCFNIFDIDLTGKVKYPKYPAGLPADVLNAKYHANGALPEPIFKVGKTAVNVHLLGYRKGMKRTATMYVNSFYPDTQNEYAAKIDANTGCAEFSFEQYGTNAAFVVFGGKSVSLYLAPGETVDVYVDLQAQWRAVSEEHYGDKVKTRQPTAYFKGTYAALNSEMQKNYRHYDMNIYSGKFGDPSMTADEYTDFVMKTYNEKLAEIKQDKKLSDYMRELNLLKIKAEAADALVSSGQVLEYAYREQNKLWNVKKIDYKAPKLIEKNFSRIKEIGINTPKMIYESDGIRAATWHDLSPETLTTDKEGILFDLAKVCKLPESVEQMTPLTLEQKADLASVKNPFYADVINAMEKKAKAEMEAAKSKTGYTICEVPDVADENLFDAIASKYKGKVVLVDIWATWCGPCRMAIKATEPLKDGELKNDNLAFVYLTGETSPLTKWQTMIADIRGDHYRVSNAQWMYLYKKFNIDGIPSYVVIDKDGTYQLRNDLRNHNLLKKTLLEKLE